MYKKGAQKFSFFTYQPFMHTSIYIEITNLGSISSNHTITKEQKTDK